MQYAPSLYESIINILTYNSLKGDNIHYRVDCIINYVMIVWTLLVCSWFLYKPCSLYSQLPQRHPIMMLLVGFIVLTSIQMILCLFITSCYGVSIVWSGMMGILYYHALSMVYTWWMHKEEHAPLSQYDKIQLVLLHVTSCTSIGVWIYYGIVSPLLTSVAHVCSILLGVGYTVGFEWGFERRKWILFKRSSISSPESHVGAWRESQENLVDQACIPTRISEHQDMTPTRICEHSIPTRISEHQDMTSDHQAFNPTMTSEHQDMTPQNHQYLVDQVRHHSLITVRSSSLFIQENKTKNTLYS